MKKRISARKLSIILGLLCLVVAAIILGITISIPTHTLTVLNALFSGFLAVGIVTLISSSFYKSKKR